MVEESYLSGEYLTPTCNISHLKSLVIMTESNLEETKQLKMKEGRKTNNRKLNIRQRRSNSRVFSLHQGSERNQIKGAGWLSKQDCP